MGASWAVYSKIQDLFGNTQGAFNFDGSFTGNDFADFLLGYAKSYNELAVQDHGTWNNISPAAYIQDNWHVNKRLKHQSRSALGWHSAYLRSQQPAVEFLHAALRSCQSCRSSCQGAATMLFLRIAPAWAEVPNAILSAAGTQFYLNGSASPANLVFLAAW